MKKSLSMTFLFVALPIVCLAQFNSGSTGTDGALDLAMLTCPNNICEVQLPESGVLNFTTINIPAGKTLKFKRNARNTPVFMLATQNVSIEGAIDISALNRFPGPGGFYGGEATAPGQSAGRAGLGPGGGTSKQPNGRWIGPLSLSPIVGGSGGWGEGCNFGGCRDGGGGGGAITIASSTSIIANNTASYSIIASGSRGDSLNGFGSFGSGGAIRLVANSLNISGSLYACNLSQDPNLSGLCGVVRLEALQGQLNFTGSSLPAATLIPFTANSIPSISTSNLPQLTIQSVGGYNVPSYAGSRFDTVDLLLPNQLSDPVGVAVRANNIPVGTEVRVGFVSGSSNGTSTPCSLAGTFASSFCTATISNLNRTGVTYLLATAAFTPPSSLAQYNPKGENQVAKIKLEAVLGAKPKYVFLNSQGKVIDNAKLSKNFLRFFGM